MTDIQRHTERPVAIRGRRRLVPTFAHRLADTARRCGGEVVFLPNDRLVLTGTTVEVERLLATIQNASRLVSWTPPVPFDVEGQVLVNVSLAPPVQVHSRVASRRKLPRWAFWSIIGGVVVLLGGLGWLAYAVVAAVLEHPAVLAIGGSVLVLIALLSCALGGHSGGKTFSGTFEGKID